MLKKFILWIWQLPQNLFGFLISRFAKETAIVDVVDKKVKVYFMKYFFHSGISLGNYIILERKKHFNASNKYHLNEIKHEYGHSLQSIKLGPLYLLVIGIPSFARNIYDRLFHRKWTFLERNKWYYAHFPERWADELGKVERD